MSAENGSDEGTRLQDQRPRLLGAQTNEDVVGYRLGAIMSGCMRKIHDAARRKRMPPSRKDRPHFVEIVKALQRINEWDVEVRLSQARPKTGFKARAFAGRVPIERRLHGG